MLKLSAFQGPPGEARHRSPLDLPEDSSRPGQREFRPDILVAVVVAAAGVGGALAGTHATGTAVVDPIYGGLLAGLVALVASRANRETGIILAAIAAALSRGWVLIPGLGALAVAFGSIWTGTRWRHLGAFTGALAAQAILRWTPVGFQGLTLLIGTIAVLPLAVSAYRSLTAPTRRWVIWIGPSIIGGLVLLVTPLVLGAVMSHRVVNRGALAAQVALDSASSGDSTAVSRELRTAAADFATAHRRTSGWWTWGGRLVPIFAQHQKAVAAGTATAGHLMAASAAAASSLDYRNLSYHQGALDLTRLEAMAQPLAKLDGEFRNADREFISLRSGWLLAPVQSRLENLIDKIQRANTTVDLAAQAAHDLPPILGGAGPRHYLVVFMTPAEGRGLGGYIGSFAELLADHGRMTLVRSGSTTQLDQVPKGSRSISGPADYLARYGGFKPQDRFGDLGYSPDFPTVADVIAQMYPQSGGRPIDGVLTLDPSALAALLSFTGPVSVPGLPEPITTANAAQVLLKDQYAILEPVGTTHAARHDFLTEAVAIAFPKLLAGSLPGPHAIGQSLAPEVRQGRLLFWTSHESDQPLLKRLGLDGGGTAWPTNGDFLAITTQNAGNNKLDAYLERAVDDHVVVDPTTGQVTAHLSISLHNAAPAVGLPPSVDKSFASSGLARAANRTWVSIYTPLALTGASVDSAVKSLSSSKELGMNTYSGFVDVAAGQTVTLAITLSGHVTPGTVYTMEVRQQPLAAAEHDSILITPAARWINQASGPWIPNTDHRQIHAFQFKPSR